MTHKELKQSIIDNILSDDFMILQYSDYSFIANQYVETIAENKDLLKSFIMRSQPQVAEENELRGDALQLGDVLDAQEAAA